MRQGCQPKVEMSGFAKMMGGGMMLFKMELMAPSWKDPYEPMKLFFFGKIHPILKLGPGDGGAGRIVGKTQVNQIDIFSRQIRDKAVFTGAFQIDDAVIATVIK